MLHIYCDEPTQKVKKAPAEVREIPKVPRSTKAPLRPVQNALADVREIPKVPRSTKALLHLQKAQFQKCHVTPVPH